MEFYSDSSTETLSAVQLWYTHTSKQGTERVKESGSIKKLKHTRITLGSTNYLPVSLDLFLYIEVLQGKHLCT
ncbi:hypothetical protein ROHU_012942 [Labeo rohita]|uniref:Uncharacterized protein n=1 Tax=Labeo rohita TaxID=84645 RepID=A0A498L7U5_LABRO|nr:hypothetical protein ROHU_012942 [Labeo rohita]